MKGIFSISIALALFFPLIFGILDIEMVNASPLSSFSEKTSSVEAIDIGSPAIDFDITDVDSGITYSLSQFLGKVVLIDLWATWCTPCEDSLPYIEQFYHMYPEDVFQVISVDIDNSETDAAVSTFRKSHNMDWIVGIDYDDSINEDYGSGFIPTFYAIDPTGIVRYSEIGLSSTFYDDIHGIISTYFPDDAIDPVVEALDITNNTEFSIFDTEVHVSANFSDNWNIKEAVLTAELGSNDEIFKLELVKEDGYYIASSSIMLDRMNLYNRSSVDFSVTVTDYFDNSVTKVKTLNLTEYDDSIDPIIELLEVTNNTEFSIFDTEFHIVANYSDNLKILEAEARIVFGVHDEILELKLIEDAGFYTTELSLELDLMEVYGQSSVDVYVSATDYFENEVSEKVVLNLTKYIDTEPPVISDYTYLITEVDEDKFSITVQVEVTEDLYLAEARIELYKGDTLKKVADLEPINDTHMEATLLNIYYTEGQPNDFTVKIVVTDVVGNTAELDVIIESTPTDSTSLSPFILVISAIMATGIIIRKRKR
jgi:thiol-disulfide isomerase/thioredoxin